MEETLSNHIFEIRYKPSSRFFDRRGMIAKKIIGDNFDIWDISDNKINFRSNDNQHISAFITYENLGLTSRCPLEKEDFNNISEDFIKNVWDHFNYKSIRRIGVRSNYLRKAEDFEKLFESFKDEFLGLKKEKLESFDGDLVDLGFPLDFVDGEKQINTMSGPMEYKQSNNKFGELAFDCGIYTEVDFFKKDFSPHIKQKDIIKFIKEGSSRAEKFSGKIETLLTE